MNIYENSFENVNFFCCFKNYHHNQNPSISKIMDVTFAVKTWNTHSHMVLFHCGTIRLVGLTFGGGVSTGYSTWYLVIFLVPPRLRFQASRTITKTWRVISAYHWLDEENRHCLCHWTCVTRRNRPARLKSAQPAKDQMQLFWMSALCFVVCWVSTDVPSLIAEERIQRERDGATQT